MNPEKPRLYDSLTRFGTPEDPGFTGVLPMILVQREGTVPEIVMPLWVLSAILFYLKNNPERLEGLGSSEVAPSNEFLFDPKARHNEIKAALAAAVNEPEAPAGWAEAVMERKEIKGEGESSE